jgi:hypothetical protein
LRDLFFWPKANETLEPSQVFHGYGSPSHNTQADVVPFPMKLNDYLHLLIPALSLKNLSSCYLLL